MEEKFTLRSDKELVQVIDKLLEVLEEHNLNLLESLGALETTKSLLLEYEHEWREQKAHSEHKKRTCQAYARRR